MAAEEELRPGGVIVLPPFLVEDQRFNRTVWLYSQSDGLEILSACPENETVQFMRNIRRARAALGQFIADDLTLRTSLPTTLILFPRTQKNELDEQMVKEVERIPSASDATGHFRPMDDLRLSDPDSTFIFIILDDWQWAWDIRHSYSNGRDSLLLYSPPYLRFLIESRAPAPPDWFTTGVTRLYESLAFNSTASGIFSAWTTPVDSPDNPWKNIEFDMDSWTSRESATALRENAGAPRPLLPMRELFVPVIAAGRSDIYRRVWEAQAELFVRWALSDRVKDGRVCLQKFARVSATQPVTEDLFQSCFGMNYSDARDALSDFLPVAVSKEQEFVFAAMPSDTRPVDLREATPHEIHRIKGEWARRTLRAIQSNYPRALQLYVAKARSALQIPYDRGERDPQLLASLALFRLDTGDTAGGRRLLEENPNAVAARPLAALELAELRLKGALDKPVGPNGALSEKQAQMVLRDVSEVLGKKPPIEGAYLLAAMVSRHLGRDPTDAERARLNEGALLFPRDIQMVIESVSWDLRARDFSLARRLIDLGECEAADAPSRDRLRPLDDLIRTQSAGAN